MQFYNGTEGEERLRVQDVSASNTSLREAFEATFTRARSKQYRYESIYFTAIMVMVLPCIEWARPLTSRQRSPEINKYHLELEKHL